MRFRFNDPFVDLRERKKDEYQQMMLFDTGRG